MRKSARQPTGSSPSRRRGRCLCPPPRCRPTRARPSYRSRRGASWCTGRARSSRWTPRFCVMVRAHVSGDPVKTHLTLALDVCTQSLNRHLRPRGTARDFGQASTPSPPTSSPVPPSTISTDAKPSPTGRWNLGSGNTHSPAPAPHQPSNAHQRRPQASERQRLHLDPGTTQRLHRLRKADHQPYYGALKPLLEDHAEHLAKAVDHCQ